MYKPVRKLLLSAAIMVPLVTVNSVHAAGEASANVGFMSDYVYRGIFQSDSAASAGLDYSMSGFYVGLWSADVDLGLEYDLYAGYSGEASGISYDINYTTYNYTDDAFDDKYAEVNLGLSYGAFSVGYASGTYDNYGTSQDYTVATVSAEKNGFTILYGSYGEDFDGEWYELGYSADVGGFETGINYVSSGKDLDDSDYLILSLGKTFDLK